MSRWRIITITLVIVALALWGALFVLNFRPELARELPHGFVPPSAASRFARPLSGLPGWVPSLELFITLFLAGAAELYLFPLQVKNMVQALSSSRRLVPITLLGLGFALLLLVFGIGAVLARITFPFTVLSALALLLFSVWGFLAGAFALGRLLLGKAGWGRSSPLLALALGLLLLVPLARIPFVGGLVLIFYVALGLGLVIATRFGSNQPWTLTPLLEEDVQ